MGKINDEHMKSIFGGFSLSSKGSTSSQDSLKNVEPEPVSLVPESTEEIEEEAKPTNKKKQKSTRQSFMCRISDQNLQKVRVLSALSGKSMSDYIDNSLTTFLEEYEEKYGSILSRP